MSHMPSPDMHQMRLDQRDLLDQAISDFLDCGALVEGLDVALSRKGAVDLDMMVACLYEMNHRMSAAALHDLQPQAALSFEGPLAPIRLTA